MSDKPTVFEAVSAVMNSVKAVTKDGKNTFDKYNFRGIDGVMNAVGPAMREHAVIATPIVDEIDYGTTTTGKGAVMTTVRLKMTLRWYGPAGDHIDTVVWGEAFDRGDKATAKAHSVAYRTAMLETLCLPTQEPDPDEQSYEQGAQSSAPGRSREQYVRDFAAQLEAAEQAGDEPAVMKLGKYVTDQGDGELVRMAHGVLNRMRAAQQQQAQETAQQVLDAEVVTNDPA